MNCVCCEKEAFFRWTDTHGIAVCHRCGMPYTLYHYHPETKARLDLEPSPALNEVGVEIAVRYWKETGRRTFAGHFDVLGPSHRRGDRTYSGATQEEMNLFDEWYNEEVRQGRIAATGHEEQGDDDE